MPVYYLSGTKVCAAETHATKVSLPVITATPAPVIYDANFINKIIKPSVNTTVFSILGCSGLCLMPHGSTW